MPDSRYSSAMLSIRKESWDLLEQAGCGEPSLEQKFRILDAMYELARSLGALSAKYPWDGLETTLRTARILNSVH